MTAKQEFLESPARAKFETMVIDRAFRAALDCALLTMVQSQPRGREITEAWDAHSQLVGARQFIDILTTIHIPTPELKAAKWDKLTPRA